MDTEVVALALRDAASRKIKLEKSIMTWWFWLGLAFVFIIIGLYICTQNTQTTIGVPMVGIGFVIFLVLSLPAHGHDHSKPELTPWFKSLESRAKASCCDGSDATRLDDVDWETKDGRYRVRIYGEWVDVPESAVIDGPNRAGVALAWPMRGYMGLSIRCFMPGSMT